MKNCMYLFVFLYLFQPIIVSAQIAKNEKIISFPASQLTIKEILTKIQEEYAINFAYNDNILPSKTITTKEYINIKLSVFLNDILNPLNIRYKTVGNQITLYPEKTPFERGLTISGYVTDYETKESLIGVSIYLSGARTGTITNSYGYYNIKALPGEVRLSLSYVGYQDTVISISPNRDYVLDIDLKPLVYNVEEVVVHNADKHEYLESVMMNTATLGIAALQSQPGLFGENDVLQNIAVLPGILQSEISSGSIYVRGGSADQTMFLMDEAKIYNAGHFGGFYSVFNPDLVNNVKVYKADMPVEENGAISSLIDVKLREGNSEKWHVKSGIGLIDMKASVEGPLQKEKSSMIVGFRRTYIDAITGLMRKNLEPSNLNFYFYDLNLKINSKINRKNRLFLSGYMGTDEFQIYYGLKRINQVATVRWNHLFNSKLFLNTSVNASRNFMNQTFYDYDSKFRWWRRISSIESKIEFNYLVNNYFRIKFGTNSSIVKIHPFHLDPINENSIYYKVTSHYEHLYCNFLFSEIQYKLTKRLQGSVSGRLGHHINPYENLDTQETDHVPSEEYYRKFTFEPQAYLKFSISDKIALKAGYNRQVNALHQLQLSNIGISVNRWMPANKIFNPAQSNNFSTGVYCLPYRWITISSEVYYRNMKNLVETLHNERMLTVQSPYKYLRKANGESYGADFIVNIDRKKYSGVFSYGYQFVSWKTEGINNGDPYPPPHSRPHSITMTNSLDISPRVNIILSWNYSSGTPFTPATGIYQVNGKSMISINEDNVNSRRLPDYHRLDFGINIKGKKNQIRRWKGFWNISFYNVYFRKNVFGISYFSLEENEGSNETTINLNPKYLYLYRFVPSVSYRFEF